MPYVEVEAIRQTKRKLHPPPPWQVLAPMTCSSAKCQILDISPFLRSPMVFPKSTDNVNYCTDRVSVFTHPRRASPHAQRRLVQQRRQFPEGAVVNRWKACRHRRIGHGGCTGGWRQRAFKPHQNVTTRARTNYHALNFVDQVAKGAAGGSHMPGDIECRLTSNQLHLSVEFGSGHHDLIRLKSIKRSARKGIPVGHSSCSTQYQSGPYRPTFGLHKILPLKLLGHQ